MKILPAYEGDVLAQHLAREPVHRALIRAQEHRLFAEESLARPILDIGCGDGHFAAVAFPEGIDVGIDVTRKIVVEARRNASYRHLDVADGTRMPFADASFRTVISNCVIEHIPDIEDLVAETARVLMRGGRFLFSVPSEHFTELLPTVRALRRVGLSSLAERYGRWWNANAAHYNLDSPQVWADRLARYGLQIERYRYYMSPAAMKVLELSHYYAIPSLISFRLVGRWSLRPDQVQRTFAYHWLKRYFDEPWPLTGGCCFFVALKL